MSWSSKDPTEKDVEDMLSLLAKTEDKVKGTVAKMEVLKPEFKKLGFLRRPLNCQRVQGRDTNFSAQLVKLAPAKHRDTAFSSNGPSTRISLNVRRYTMARTSLRCRLAARLEARLEARSAANPGSALSRIQ
ncbi:uncharacterized protein UTRI_02280 [Ustilago trichophora]|uniref:Uncharacterized protein n=1 Tax=Ustilago trichophora TaxID=86804 RepID=A0A5C3E8T6_9BASI|nr:uncharacterized protein UTRI_02280 [Ustilago trichophora]